MFKLPGTGNALRALTGALLSGMLWVCLAVDPAHAADPVKVGFSMALTGSVAANGKQLLAALEIWRDDVNAKGALLNRRVELVYYDDQSNPNSVPAIYTKLISVDKVDALLGPYATNMVAPAMPIIMQNDKTTISILAIGINKHFKYPGVADLLKRYQAKAAGLGIDPLGINFVPFGYAAGQVLAQSVQETNSFDDSKRAQYTRGHTFRTVVGDVAFGADGEWARSRMFFTQFQKVAPNDLEQFRDGGKQIVLWPPEYKTGDIVYPYSKARARSD